MLENLLNTKLKKKLLNIFFGSPQRSFSVSELRMLTQGSSRLAAQAVRGLASAQVVRTASRGKLRYYAVNPYFSFYDELEDLIAEPGYRGEDQVGRLVKRIPNLKLAVLSGIFTLQPQLPVDVFLVGEGTSRARLQRVMAEIERFVGQEVNYTFMDLPEFQYRRMMNDRLVRDVLDYPHLVVLNSIKSLK